MWQCRRRRPQALPSICLLCATLLLLLACGDVVYTGVAALRVRPTMTSITLEVGDEELCVYSLGKDFYEGVAMRYRVVDGDDDFDIIVRDRDNRTIYASYAGEHALHGRLYFTTHTRQEHAYCIDNRRYSKARKRVQIDVGTTSLARWKTRLDPLRKLMSQSRGYFLGMSDDHVMLRIREQTLRAELEKTQRLMTYRNVAEALVIVFVAFVNVLLVACVLRRSGRRRGTKPPPPSSSSS